MTFRHAAVIPALNEAANIAAVIVDLLAHGTGLIVVVDNDSTDGTGAAATSAGAHVIVEARRGYGYACAAGAAEAARLGAEIIVFIDGDGSCDASEVGDLLAPINHDRSDLVLGSRTLGDIAKGSMPPHQQFGNWLSAAMMRRLYRTDLTDLGPFRAVRTETLVGLDLQEMTFGWPTEMTTKAVRAGARVVEVPVSWRARNAGRSKVSGTIKGSALAAWHILRVTLRHRR